MSVYNTVINFYHLWDDSVYINNATDDDDNYDHRDDGNEWRAESLAHNTGNWRDQWVSQLNWVRVIQLKI